MLLKSVVKSHCFPIDGQRQTGFGLLEALVALALLSGIGFAVLAWIQQNLDSTQRMRGFYSEQEMRRTIEAFAYKLNPMETPSGEMPLGANLLSWKSELKEGRMSQAGYPQGVGLHDIALYNVTISVFRKNEDSPWLVESVTSVGHKKVRDLGNPFKD